MPRAGLIQGQLLRNGCEQVLDILGSLGRRLEEEETGLAGVRFSIGGRDGALVGLLGD